MTQYSFTDSDGQVIQPFDAYKYTGSSTSANMIQNWVKGGPIPTTGGVETRDYNAFGLRLGMGQIPTAINPGDWIVRSPEGKFKRENKQDFARKYLSLPEPPLTLSTLVDIIEETFHESLKSHRNPLAVDWRYIKGGTDVIRILRRISEA